MNSTDAVTTIESVEQLTLYSLDRSLEALEQLGEQCRKCAAAVDASRFDKAIPALRGITELLYEFDLFENELCSLFGTERSRIADALGSLADTKAAFRGVQDGLCTCLEVRDNAALAGLLRDTLPHVLARYRQLLPLLRAEIDEQYVQTAD